MTISTPPAFESAHPVFRSTFPVRPIRFLRRTRLLGVAAIAAFAGTALHAQTIFPQTAVGSSAAAQSVSVTVTGTGTVTSVAVLTMGAPNLDYTEPSGGDNCVGISSGSCSVSVVFGPKFPGRRNGAVVLLGAGSAVLGTTYLTGIGAGPLAVLSPGTIDVTAGQVGEWTQLGDGGPATKADLFLPSGVAVDGAGDLFIADSNHDRVREVLAAAQGAIPAGSMITVAGNGNAGYDPTATLATATSLNIPSSVAVDGAGNLYIADTNNNIVREVNLTLGTIATVAGSGVPGYSGDGGAATSAELNSPKGITVDAAGNLYIADTDNNVIREVSGGKISTVVGFYPGNPGFAGDGGAATAAQLDAPYGVALDPSGNLYIADSGNARVRQVNTSNQISTYAGNGTAGYSGDGGQATLAELNSPLGVACDPAGNVYIADARNYVVRKVTSTGLEISTVAGNNATSTYNDGKSGYTYGNGQNGERFTGNGIAAGAPPTISGAGIYAPYAVAVDASGNLFVAEYFDHIIREVNAGQATLFFSPQLWENQVSAPQAQTIVNIGNAALTFSNLSSDANAAYDTATTSCTTSASVGVNSSCTVGAEFAPTTAGNPDVGNVQLTANPSATALDVQTVGQSLAQNQVSVALSSTPNPSNFGQNVTFSVVVTQAPSSTQGTPTGTVSFTDTFGGATNPIGTTQTLSAGAAKLQLNNLAVGTHMITATYNGNTYYQSATSNVLSQVVNEQVTVTLVNSSGNNPSVLGANVTFQATVAISGGIGVTNAVSFYDGATFLGSAPPNASGVATYTTATLPLGSNSITATYTDANNVTGTSAPLVQQVQQQTATTVTSSLNPSLHGNSVTFTATVLATGTVTPTGTVAFYDGTTKLGTGNLVAAGASTGAATFMTAALAVGTHSITAVYAGDTDDFGSTSAAIQQVVQDATTGTALTASANPSVAGAKLTLTAAVTVTAGAGVPTGTVNFYSGSVLLGAGTLNGGGVATYSTSSLAVGTYSLTAVYEGDTNNSGSTSSALLLSVIQATTSVKLAASSLAITVTTPVTLTATVTGTGAVPTGTVTFKDGATAIGSGTLNSGGIATLTTSSLAVGSHSITAVYAGDKNNEGETSAAVTITVSAFASKTVLAASATTVSASLPLSLLTTTSSASATPPTGSVTFTSGATTLGTATLNADGAGTLTVTLTAGTYTIAAQYSGDSLNAPSTSNTVTVTVGPTTQFTIQLSPSTLTIPTKQYGITNITLASEAGYTDTMALGCSSLPYSVTCNFSQNDVTLNANGTATVQLTVDTNSPLIGGGQAKNQMPGPRSGLVAAFVFPGSALFGLAFWRFRKRHAVLRALAIVAMLAGATLLTNGCGGLSLNSAKAGTYVIQITATGQKTSVSHVANLTVQVTQ